MGTIPVATSHSYSVCPESSWITWKICDSSVAVRFEGAPMWDGGEPGLLPPKPIMLSQRVDQWGMGVGRGFPDI